MTSLSRYISKLDSVLSRYVRERDSECITCGSTRNLQCGHFMGRTAMSTRFDERNCNAQCPKCNSMEHGDTDAYKHRIDEKWGGGTADELMRLSKQIRKYDKHELKELIRKYESFFKHKQHTQ